jgi:hypothetical protein
MPSNPTNPRTMLLPLILTMMMMTLNFRTIPRSPAPRRVPSSSSWLASILLDSGRSHVVRDRRATSTRGELISSPREGGGHDTHRSARVHSHRHSNNSSPRWHAKHRGEGPAPLRNLGFVDIAATSASALGRVMHRFLISFTFNKCCNASQKITRENKKNSGFSRFFFWLFFSLSLSFFLDRSVNEDLRAYTYIYVCIYYVCVLSIFRSITP